MQTILLKQTDSEINFDVVDNKKKKPHGKTTNIFRLLDFVFITTTSFEVL